MNNNEKSFGLMSNNHHNNHNGTNHNHRMVNHHSNSNGHTINKQTLKLGNIIPGFILKLWKMLNDTTCVNLISWADDGRSFIILDSARFSNTLSRYFKHNNLSSFIRQLNMYGFRKVASVENCGYHTSSDDLHFYHPNFIRSQPQQLELIKRKLPQKNGDSVDFSSVIKDIETIEHKQGSVDASLLDIKRENELLWSELRDLRERHQQQQLFIGNLMKFVLDSLKQQAGMKGGSNHHMLALKRKKQTLMISGSDDDSSTATTIDTSAKKYKRTKLSASDPMSSSDLTQATNLVGIDTLNNELCTSVGAIKEASNLIERKKNAAPSPATDEDNKASVRVAMAQSRVPQLRSIYSNHESPDQQIPTVTRMTANGNNSTPILKLIDCDTGPSDQIVVNGNVIESSSPIVQSPSGLSDPLSPIHQLETHEVVESSSDNNIVMRHLPSTIHPTMISNENQANYCIAAQQQHQQPVVIGLDTIETPNLIHPELLVTSPLDDVVVPPTTTVSQMPTPTIGDRCYVTGDTTQVTGVGAGASLTTASVPTQTMVDNLKPIHESAFTAATGTPALNVDNPVATELVATNNGLTSHYNFSRVLLHDQLDQIENHIDLLHNNIMDGADYEGLDFSNLFDEIERGQ